MAGGMNVGSLYNTLRGQGQAWLARRSGYQNGLTDIRRRFRYRQHQHQHQAERVRCIIKLCFTGSALANSSHTHDKAQHFVIQCAFAFQ